jgi:hypothetical protein
MPKRVAGRLTVGQRHGQNLSSVEVEAGECRVYAALALVTSSRRRNLGCL